MFQLVEVDVEGEVVDVLVEGHDLLLGERVHPGEQGALHLLDALENKRN